MPWFGNPGIKPRKTWIRFRKPRGAKSGWVLTWGVAILGGEGDEQKSQTPKKITNGMDCLNKNGMEQIYGSPYIASRKHRGIPYKVKPTIKRIVYYR